MTKTAEVLRPAPKNVLPAASEIKGPVAGVKILTETAPIVANSGISSKDNRSAIPVGILTRKHNGEPDPQPEGHYDRNKRVFTPSGREDFSQYDTDSVSGVKRKTDDVKID